ncbi:MAG: ATP-binding cassette domain-containing protein, partial [Mariniblastus sp.]
MMIEQLLDQEQESIVDVEKLSVTFGNQEVLKDITLRIPPGQTLALLGESGCGKTVLMKSIIGLVKPTVGTIEFDG